MIAMALACGPDLVIADEPTTALDVTVQAQVLAVLRDQVVAKNTALILITHDLPVVASVTDDVVVLRGGNVVERGTSRQVFGAPTSAYTAELVDAVPPMSRSLSAVGKPAAPDPTGTPLVTVSDVRKRYKLRAHWVAGIASNHRRPGWRLDADLSGRDVRRGGRIRIGKVHAGPDDGGLGSPDIGAR